MNIISDRAYHSFSRRHATVSTCFVLRNMIISILSKIKNAGIPAASISLAMYLYCNQL